MSGMGESRNSPRSEVERSGPQRSLRSNRFRTWLLGGAQVQTGVP